MIYKLNGVKQTSKELQANLDQFYGTELYYINPLMKFTYTEGVKYFAENAGAYWLLQEINFIYVDLQQIGKAEFLNIKVISKDNKADIIVDDGNDNILKKKHIAFTDLPEGEWKFFLTNNVLLLPSEY